MAKFRRRQGPTGQLDYLEEEFGVLLYHKECGGDCCVHNLPDGQRMWVCLVCSARWRSDKYGRMYRCEYSPEPGWQTAEARERWAAIEEAERRRLTGP